MTFFIAIRNLTIALLLSWLGFTASEDTRKVDDAKPDTDPTSAIAAVFPG